MAKYRISLVIGAQATAGCGPSCNRRGCLKYIGEWERIEVEEVPKPKYASGRFVSGTMPVVGSKYGTV